MVSSHKDPEIYYTRPNAHCPNSHLPVLVYRSVLSAPYDIARAAALFAQNDWIYDQSWGHDARAHYHTTTPECYAATAGKTKCLYGVGPLDDAERDGGVVFEMRAGDVAVHAAGVSHCCLPGEGSGEYRFMAFYPKGFPPYDSHDSTKNAEDTETMRKQSRQVPIPQRDPVYGVNGPLPTLWKGADAST